MRFIEIANRLHPFSHSSAVQVLVPHTEVKATIYPARLLFKRDFPLNVRGPVKEFTVVLDLEKGCVRVSGHAQNGFFRYALWGEEIVVEREPEGGLGLPHGVKPTFPPLQERLSLGSHKKQEIERLTTLEEILPLWCALGERLPVAEGAGGVLELLKREPVDFSLLYKLGFEGLLSPRLEDKEFQGVDLPPVLKGSSPLALISKGREAIRKLFVEFDGERLSLHPPFHAGRLLGWRFHDLTLDMEWMGHKIQRVKIVSSKKTALQLLLPREIKSFRLLRKRCDPMTRLEVGEEPLFLDRFEK